MNVCSRYLILFCVLALKFEARSQDSYSDKLDAFRKSFYSIFFQTELPPDEYMYTVTYDAGYGISTGDSLEKPRRVELWGMQYFKQRSVSAKVKFKKSQLPEKPKIIEDKYYLFKRVNDNYKDYFQILDKTTNDSLYFVIWEYLENAIHTDKINESYFPANHLIVYSIENSRGKRTYYLSSLKSTVRLKIKIKKKDLSFMKERDEPVKDLEMWAISHLFGQYCNEGYVCYTLEELD